MLYEESKKVEALCNHCSELKSARGAGTTAACNTEIVKCLQWDSIGAACDPLCGVVWLEIIRRGLTSKMRDSHSNKPDSWSGAVWWVNHLTAPNPHSVSTLVRLVWDSSQEFKGVSLNGVLLKGPDVLNPIQAVLLRFWEGEHAAIGDVSKMYSCVVGGSGGACPLFPLEQLISRGH